METNFFQQVNALNDTYGWRINIIPNNDKKLVVSVMLYDPTNESKAVKVMQTLNLEGTAVELDAGFFDAITSPIQKKASLLTNERQFLQSLEESKKQSKPEQKAKQVKPAEAKEATFETEMEKVSQLEQQGKFNEALMALPKADNYPENADEIEQKRMDLWEAIDKKDKNLFS